MPRKRGLMILLRQYIFETITKQTINLPITTGILLLFLQFRFHLMNLYISQAFLPPGSADSDPGGISLCGSRSETLDKRYTHSQILQTFHRQDNIDDARGLSAPWGLFMQYTGPHTLSYISLLYQVIKEQTIGNVSPPA